jgi:hypothetical protein
MDTGSALGGTGLFISLIGIIYSAINHKHLKARCCGKDLDISIDIDSTDSDHKHTGAKADTGEKKEEVQAKPDVKPDANASGVGLKPRAYEDKISSIGFKPPIFKVHPLFEN